MDNNQIDVCLLVPKRDEFRAVLNVFGVAEAIDDLDYLRGEQYPFTIVEQGEKRVALVAINDQGNSRSAAAASAVLSQLRPTHIILVGTAAGNSSRTAIGEVHFSERVWHVSEWVATDQGDQPRADLKEIRNDLRRDMGSFVDDRRIRELYRQELYVALAGDADFGETDALFHDLSHRLALSRFISSDYLSRTRERMDLLWRIDDRAEVYDMETGGLGAAASNEPSVFWGAIRGVSDVGDNQKDSLPQARIAATYAAAVAAKLFCLHGMARSDPAMLRPNLITAPRLADSQYYAANSSNYILDRVRLDLGVDLPVNSLARHISFKKFMVMVESYAGRRLTDEDVSRLDVIRREYYVSKYLNYNYEEDIRGHFQGWANEFRSVLALNGREFLSHSSAIDVGVGNGLELKSILSTVESIWGVDIDPKLLERASAVRNDLVPVIGSADSMPGVSNDAFDLYVSLRTLVCRFIDVELALAEALRILKPGGLLVISIPNGYREFRDGNSVVVRGLKEPGGTDFVDVQRPHEILREYFKHLSSLGFERIFYHAELTDIYLTAQKPGGSYSFPPRIAAGGDPDVSPLGE